MSTHDRSDDVREAVTKEVSEEGPAVVVKRTPSVKTREFWVGWTTVGANVLLPLSIFIAGWGVWEQNLQSKRNAASITVNQFFDDGLVSEQTTLFSLWTKQDLTVLQSPQSREFIDAFVERTIRASELDGDKVSKAIVSITSYFDRVESCIANRRCDENEVMNQIGNYGRDFQCIFAGQIEKLRNETLVAHLGEGLNAFATRAGGCGS